MTFLNLYRLYEQKSAKKGKDFFHLKLLGEYAENTHGVVAKTPLVCSSNTLHGPDFIQKKS